MSILFPILISIFVLYSPYIYIYIHIYIAIWTESVTIKTGKNALDVTIKSRNIRGESCLRPVKSRLCFGISGIRPEQFRSLLCKFRNPSGGNLKFALQTPGFVRSNSGIRVVNSRVRPKQFGSLFCKFRSSSGAIPEFVLQIPELVRSNSEVYFTDFGVCPEQFRSSCCDFRSLSGAIPEFVLRIPEFVRSNSGLCFG